MNISSTQVRQSPRSQPYSGGNASTPSPSKPESRFAYSPHYDDTVLAAGVGVVPALLGFGAGLMGDSYAAAGVSAGMLCGAGTGIGLAKWSGAGSRENYETMGIWMGMFAAVPATAGALLGIGARHLIAAF